MKVLNVNMSIDPVNGGGTAERTMMLSRFLGLSGIKCTILTTDAGTGFKGMIKELHYNNVNIVPLSCLLRRFYLPKFSMSKIMSLVRDADVVHIMGHWTVINVLVFIAIKIEGKPYAVCPAGTMPVYGRSKLLKILFNFIIGKKIIKNADAHIAISPDEIQHFAQYGVDRNKVTLIPNGVDASSFDVLNNGRFREKHGLVGTPFVLFFGRLNYIKGPDLLLEAFYGIKEEFNDVHLVFAGPDDGMLNKLQVMAEKYRLEERVHFVGYLGGDERAQAYFDADLLAIPSRQEAMSIVVLEAGITGTPVLITNQCGFDQVDEVGGGIVVDATVNAIQKGLTRLFRDRASLGEMGFELQKFTNKNYSWDVIGQKYIQLFKSISNT